MQRKDRLKTVESVKILEWAREIQALAQTGLHYAHDQYQKDRCHSLMEIAAEMTAGQCNIETPALLNNAGGLGGCRRYSFQSG